MENTILDAAKPIPPYFKFCGVCGTAYCGVTYKSATCKECGTTVYNSPKSVASAIVPVGYQDAHFVWHILGMIVIERGIDPGKGKLALPGGFFDSYESWQEAAVRELLEETGIEKPADQITLLGVDTSTNKFRHHLVFGVTSPLAISPNGPPCLPPEVLAAFEARAPKEKAETPHISILTEPPDELAFTSHTAMARLFFERYRRG